MNFDFLCRRRLLAVGDEETRMLFCVFVCVFAQNVKCSDGLDNTTVY